MKRFTRHSSLIAIALLSAVIANPQSEGAPIKHFEKDGLAFDYPADWNLVESSEESVLTVTLRPKTSETQIIVTLRNGPTQSCDFQAEGTAIGKALNEQVATQIKAGGAPSAVRTLIGASEFPGTELHGVINRKRATGSVYSIRLNRRFVSLVYVRVDNDKDAGSAWNTIRTALKVEPSVMTVLGTRTADSSETAITSGVLNGRALVLPKPNYPPIAAKAHASGTVTVQVTIDESGNVISADAIEGHPLLRAVSAAAAREARFSPTKLCDEAVKVTGVITYNFVAH